jgi:hypothetical protein
MSINKYEFEWAKAIAKDDWRAIEQQIENGLNVNRGPILHTAIQQKRFAIARKLIENGADINKVNKKGKSPLQILIENHRLNPPRKGRRPNYRQRRPSHLGAGDTQDVGTNQNRALEFGRFMLEKGANPIVGQNEGDDHEIYQDFYKHKTKISRQEYEKLRAIINRGDINALEQDLENNVTVQCAGPHDPECLNRGLLHLAVLAPNYKIIKLLLDKGADPNYEDVNGATPLYMVFHPIEYKDRKKYCDEKSIPKELLMWPDQSTDPRKPGRNDELVRIGQALLQAGARFVPDHSPDIDKKAINDKYPNCPLIIFWHLYSKYSGGSSAAGNDPIISVAERNRHWKRSQKDRRVK